MRNQTQKKPNTLIGLLFLGALLFFFLPNIGANRCVCVFFVCFFFPGKVHMPFIHSISQLFFFFPQRKKKKQLFHSFIRNSSKMHKKELIRGNKKIRYLWSRLKYLQFWIFQVKFYQKSIFPSNRALLSSTFSTFCHKITNMSRKYTYYWPKKSKKYSIIRSDLIDFFSNRALLLSSTFSTL